MAELTSSTPLDELLQAAIWDDSPEMSSLLLRVTVQEQQAELMDSDYIETSEQAYCATCTIYYDELKCPKCQN